MLQCVDRESVAAAAVYLASRSLARQNLGKLSQRAALGVPAATELDRYLSRMQIEFDY